MSDVSGMARLTVDQPQGMSSQVLEVMAVEQASESGGLKFEGESYSEGLSYRLWEVEQSTTPILGGQVMDVQGRCLGY